VEGLELVFGRFLALDFQNNFWCSLVMAQIKAYFSKRLAAFMQ
jgi:hypothetical protein